MRCELAERGVEMLAISPDTVAEAAAMRRKLGLGLRLLTDEFLSVTDLYNLRHEKGMAADGKRGVIRPLAIPTTFLIGPDGRVLWIDRTRDYRVRSDAPRVLEAVARALGGAAPSD